MAIPVSNPIIMYFAISIRNVSGEAGCFDLNSNLLRVEDLGEDVFGLHLHGSRAKNINGSHRWAGMFPSLPAFQYCSHVPAPMYNMLMTWCASFGNEPSLHR